jgi:hypothetical protein
MKVLMISPGFPDDMPYFTRGLAEAGATVLGVGDQPAAALRPDAARALADYLQVADLWNEDQTVAKVVEWLGRRGLRVERVECLWEPGVVLAAKLRARLGLPGLSIDQARAFRDKETMKQVLDAAGVRTPHHYRAGTAEEVRQATARIGYPVIVKPIAGAGSADTYTARSDEELDGVLARVRHVTEVSVEEFVEGEEFTYDTVCAGGRVLFQNVAWYRPKPLTARLTPWISPQAVCLRDLEQPEIAPGVELGHRVLSALGFETGFTHMEWFRTAAGEAVFGEIAARSPGGRLTHGMNLSCDADLFLAWGQAVVSGAIHQDLTKKFNAAMVFKRAEGAGERIARVEGLEPILAEHGEHVPLIDLVPIGAPRRDWTQVVTGDGWMVARHPDLQACLRIADRLSSEVRLIAG